jgi:glycosyltransferase involved in cell wall biosynthesis
MVAEPALTVCIPTFNRSRFLRECVQSVLSQAFTNFELVIIDDASTDDTPGVVAWFSDPRIRYIRHERNIGLPANFNECLRTARSEFVIIFHDDDAMLPDLLGQEFEVLKSAPDVVFVHCAARLADEHGIIFSAPSQKWPPITQGLDFVRLYWGSEDCPVRMPGVMLRRFVALKLGGFNEELKYNLDADLWQRMAFEGRVAYLNEVLFSNRVHPGRTTNKILRDGVRMLVDHHNYVMATRQLLERHQANIDSLMSRQLAVKVASDLTNLRALGEPLPAILRYFREGVRRHPRSWLSLRLYCYLFLACLPRGIVLALKKVRRRVALTRASPAQKV